MLDKNHQIRILEQNVADLQAQLYQAYKRIAELSDNSHDQNSRKIAKGLDCCM